MDESERAKEMSFLQFELDEIENAELKEGEDEELETLFRRMENGKKLTQGAASAYQYTSEGDGSASENLSRAIRMLSEITGYDERAGQLYGQLSEIDSLLNDFNRELADYLSSCEFSEEEFYETEMKDRPIDFSGGDVGVFGQAFIDEPLVMSQIQICFRAVIGDEDFSVLNGVHGAGVDVDVRIEFLHGDMVASGL